MARKNTVVVNKNETAIVEEKKDGEGVNIVATSETSTDLQNSGGIDKNADMDNSSEGEPTGETDTTEQTGGDTGSDEVNQTGDDKKNPQGRGGKKRIQHTGLKNGKVIVFDGSVVVFNEEGIGEIDDKYAEYLLQIPGYIQVS